MRFSALCPGGGGAFAGALVGALVGAVSGCVSGCFRGCVSGYGGWEMLLIIFYTELLSHVPFSVTFMTQASEASVVFGPGWCGDKFGPNVCSKCKFSAFRAV